MRGHFLVLALLCTGWLAGCRDKPPSLGPAAAPAAVASPARVEPIVAAATAPDPAAEADSARPIGPKPRGAAKALVRRKPKAAVVGVVNLNRATEAELKLLPGIGKGRARAI